MKVSHQKDKVYKLFNQEIVHKNIGSNKWAVICRVKKCGCLKPEIEEKYVVEFWDDEDRDIGIEPHWYRVPLEMCRQGLLCEECQKDIAHLDSCDYTFDWTPSKQVALDKKQSLEEDGLVVRVLSNEELINSD